MKHPVNFILELINDKFNEFIALGIPAMSRPVKQNIFTSASQQYIRFSALRLLSSRALSSEKHLKFIWFCRIFKDLKFYLFLVKNWSGQWGQV